MKKLLPIALLSSLAVLTNAHATIFLNETFSYPDGALTTNSGNLWTGYSAAGSTPVQVVSGEAVLAQGSGSREDVDRDVGSTMGPGDTWYYSLDLSVSGDSSANYFAFLWQSSSIFAARLFVEPPASGGDYTLGISGSSTAGATWGSDLSFGSTHKVVVEYGYDSQNITLWVDPSSESSTSVSFNSGFSDTPSAFGLRQASGSTATQTIDNLIVSDNFNEALTGVPVPEPSSVALLFSALGLIGFVKRKRVA